MDKLTTQQRHANMAAIRSKDTKPEMIVWISGTGTLIQRKGHS